MKKIYSCLLLIFFILFSNLSYSQVSFGVKSGINIATTKGLIAFPKNRVGCYGGAFAKIPLRNKFFLHPELLYSSKGFGVNQTNPLNAPNATYRLNYLNLPILLGYEIDRKTSAFFGPELGYLISVHQVYRHDENFNVSKDFPPKFDVGMGIGLNYKLVKNIGIELRYIYGFNTLYDVDAIGNRHGDGINGAHRVLQIGVNYSF